MKVLFFSREFGDWERMDIGPERSNVTLKGLKCGTKYQFYIQVRNIFPSTRTLSTTLLFKAVNDFGVGERTETVSTSTSGASPIAPADANDLIRVNSTAIDINLRAWADGGCQVSR